MNIQVDGSKLPRLYNNSNFYARYSLKFVLSVAIFISVIMVIEVCKMENIWVIVSYLFISNYIISFITT